MHFQETRDEISRVIAALVSACANSRYRTSTPAPYFGARISCATFLGRYSYHHGVPVRVLSESRRDQVPCVSVFRNALSSENSPWRDRIVAVSHRFSAKLRKVGAVQKRRSVGRKRTVASLFSNRKLRRIFAPLNLSRCDQR